MAKSGESDGRIFHDFHMAEFGKCYVMKEFIWQNSSVNAIFYRSLWQNTLKNYGMKFKISLFIK